MLHFVPLDGVVRPIPFSLTQNAKQHKTSIVSIVFNVYILSAFFTVSLSLQLNGLLHFIPLGAPKQTGPIQNTAELRHTVSEKRRRAGFLTSWWKCIAQDHSVSDTSLQTWLLCAVNIKYIYEMIDFTFLWCLAVHGLGSLCTNGVSVMMWMIHKVRTRRRQLCEMSQDVIFRWMSIRASFAVSLLLANRLSLCIYRG